MIGRLQFVHATSPFKSRELAHKYITENLERQSIIGEPIVVTYYNNGNIGDLQLIFGIGKGVDDNGNNLGYHVIDTKEMDEHSSELVLLVNELKTELSKEKTEREEEDLKLSEMITSLKEEIVNLINEESKIREENDSALSKEIQTNKIVSVISENESTVSRIEPSDSGATLFIDVKLDNRNEFLKNSEYGLTDSGIKEFVGNELTNLEVSIIEKINENEDKSVSADQKLNEAILNEAKTREDADDALHLEIDAERNRAQSKENELKELIDSEVIRSISAETSLSSTVSSHTENIDIHITRDDRTKWNYAYEEINAFITAATVGDAAIDTLKEIQDYINTDGAAASQMAEKIAKNTESIEVLKNDVSTVESTLNTKIDSTKIELSSKIDTDIVSAKTEINDIIGSGFTKSSPISEQLSAVKATADASASKDLLQTELAKKADITDLNKEITDRISAINSLTTAISNESTRATNAENELTISISDIKKDYLTSSDKNAIMSVLDTKATITSLNDEKHARELKDNKLETDITNIKSDYSKKSDVSASVSALTVMIDSKVSNDVYNREISDLIAKDDAILSALTLSISNETKRAEGVENAISAATDSIKSLVGDDTVQKQIENSIGNLEVADSYVEGYFVSEVDQNNGLITVGRLPFSTITSALTDNISTLENEVTSIENKMGILETSNKEIKNGLDNANANINTLTSNFNSISSDVANNKAEITSIKEKLDNLNVETGGTVNPDELVKIQEQINDLSEIVGSGFTGATITKVIQDNELVVSEALNEHNEKIIELEEKINILETALKRILGVSDFSLDDSVYAITNVVSGEGNEISVSQDKNTVTIDFNSDILGGIVE